MEITIKRYSRKMTYAAVVNDILEREKRKGRRTITDPIDQDQANKIFEILNAKGKQLARIDLIKN